MVATALHLLVRPHLLLARHLPRVMVATALLLQVRLRALALARTAPLQPQATVQSPAFQARSLRLASFTQAPLAALPLLLPLQSAGARALRRTVLSPNPRFAATLPSASASAIRAAPLMIRPISNGWPPTAQLQAEALQAPSLRLALPTQAVPAILLDMHLALAHTLTQAAL
jgi:hypothetical protein